MSQTTSEDFTTARIEADPELPIIRITRDFRATPQQLLRAHTDPELFARWVGPASVTTEIDQWDARDGGSWRYIVRRDGFETSSSVAASTRSPPIASCRPSRGRSSPTGSPWRRSPSKTSVAAGPGSTPSRWSTASPVRDAWLASGMESGVNEGYAALDDLISAGAVG